MKVDEFVGKAKHYTQPYESDCPCGSWECVKEAITIIERQRAALDWIHGACGYSGKCKCGRPTGVSAVKSCARAELEKEV